MLRHGRLGYDYVEGFMPRSVGLLLGTVRVGAIDFSAEYGVNTAHGLSGGKHCQEPYVQRVGDLLTFSFASHSSTF